MAKIVMREMQTGTAQSDGKMYPHLISMGVKTMEDVCEHLGRETTMNPAEIRAAVAMLAKELAMWMGMGYTVRVDALGTFRPALRLKKGAEQETADSETRRNAVNIEIGRVTFHADKELLYEANRLSDFERVRPKRRKSPAGPMPEAERREALRNFLKQNRVARINDYVRLTGLSRYKACMELRRIAGEEGTFLQPMGRVPHRFYMLAEDSPHDGEQ